MELLWKLSEIRTDFLNVLFKFFTLFGEETFVLAVICGLYWCINKNLTYKIGMSYFFSGIAAQSLKIICRVPRPWVKDPSFTPLEGSLKTATGYSFPSGHTQTATSIYGTFAINTKKLWLKCLMVLLIAAVGLSRMYMGVHTPQDVIWGFLISIVLTISVNLCMNKSSSQRTDLILCIVLTAVSAISAIYAVILQNSGIIEAQHAQDLCKMSGAAVGFAISFYIERKHINFNERSSGFLKNVVKLFIGIVILLAIKAGLKPLLGTGTAGGFIRYMLMIIWAMCLYPLIIKKYQQAHNS